MPNNESKVEKRLHQGFTSKLNGTTRKWVSPGRIGVPDRICIMPTTVGELISKLSKLPKDKVVAEYFLVEVKTEKGKLSGPQERELKRLGEIGCNTAVVYGDLQVDELIKAIREG